MIGGLRGLRLMVMVLLLQGAGCTTAGTTAVLQDGDPLPEMAESLVGDPARGESLFKQPVIGPGRVAGCITCHSLTPDTVLVGPSLADIGRTAAENRDPTAAAEFLKQSIAQPDQTVTSGFDSGVMIQSYGEDLTSQEIADLVAFLLTLRTD